MKSAPRLYFSFRSPFSWLLVERLRRAVPDAFERVELLPYWEPDARTAAALAERDAVIHYAPMSKAKHLYILQDVKRLAGRIGLTVSWPVDTAPWWELSHLGWLAARRDGRAVAFYDAVVNARWQRGADISRPDVIGELASQAGLDRGAIVVAVDDPAILSEGVECLCQAYQDDVFGVPYMRYGWQRFWGLDRLDDFLAAAAPALGSAAAEPARPLGFAPSPPDGPLAGVPAAVRQAPGMYDNDTAGGCG